MIIRYEGIFPECGRNNRYYDEQVHTELDGNIKDYERQDNILSN